MKYEDRKLCGLINLHSGVPGLRCPQLFESKANKSSSCDGCELFEKYLSFRERSIELKEQNKCE